MRREPREDVWLDACVSLAVHKNSEVLQRNPGLAWMFDDRDADHEHQAESLTPGQAAPLKIRPGRSTCANEAFKIAPSISYVQAAGSPSS